MAGKTNVQSGALADPNMSQGAHLPLFALFLFLILLSLARAAGNSDGSTSINPISVQIVPDPAVRDSPAHFYVKTNSEYGLNETKCLRPTGTGICKCEIGYAGSDSNFECLVLPPVFGTYSISLKDVRRERGSMAITIAEPKVIESHDATIPPKIPNGPTFEPITRDKPAQWPILLLFLATVLYTVYEFREHLLKRD